MVREEAFGSLLDQIRDIIAIAHEGKSSLFNKDLPEDAEVRLEAVEAAFQIFKTINEEALRIGGEKGEQLDKTVEEVPDYLSAKQRAFILKANKLKADIEGMQKELDFYRRAIKNKQGIQGKKKGKQGAGRARKKKFRAIGGKKGWEAV